MTRAEPDRERAARETGRSFAVEASAGTGKTSILIERILSLVLKRGPQGPPIPLSRIAAITFTEKAAGEMRLRLRREFERRASASDAEGERAKRALRDLGAAAISTIHAFAVALLKERPVEAGLDPHFAAMDELKSELFFRQVWQAWLGKAVGDRNRILEHALREGLALPELMETARILRLHWPAVREGRLADPAAQERIPSLVEEGAKLRLLAKDAGDALAGNLKQALDWLESWPQPRAVPRKSGSIGKGDNWLGGRDAVERVRRFIAKVVELYEELSGSAAQRLFGDVVQWLVEGFLAEWQKRKREEAVLDFDDQLVAARDLLKSSRSARRYFQNRFATLLVDEFQDTDPVQLEIALLLADTRLDESDPERLRAAPGRLFIVGDPKQSIYRFRGADVETYLEAVGRWPEPDRLKLTTNFRSVPSILAFVDAVFGLLMKAESGRYQPSYLAFEKTGRRAEEPGAPAVHLLADAEEGRDRACSAADFVRGEAARITQLIAGIRGNERWQVLERERGTWRLPAYADIAVLLPVLTRADVLEDALREAGIPYVLEGGKFYYARSEVSSAITVLRAVANPNDSLALYGALRSIFFGLSDEDLLRARIEGRPLDYRQEAPRGSPLSRPFEVLLDLHLHRHRRPASETFEILLLETGAREVLSARPGGFQSLANLGKLARNLRARQPGMTFPEVVDFLAATDEEEFDESESRIVDERSNAVRIMTIHKAKGLDFPIVVVAGLGLKRPAQAPRFLAGARSARVYAVSAGRKELGFRTPGWKDLSELDRQRQDAELHRLLYVAMTRARDHLVVSTLVKWNEDRRKPEVKGTRLEHVYELFSEMLSTGSPLVRRVDVKGLRSAGGAVPETHALEKDWKGIYRRECAEHHRLISETPFSREVRAPAEHAAPSSEADQGREERYREAARDRALRVGIAFHEAMEAADFQDDARIAEWVAEAGKRQSLDAGGVSQVEEMMRRCFASEVICRARAASARGGGVLRELPYVRPLAGGAMEEGKIDLVFQEDGGWVIVDYKTDRIPEDPSVIEAYFREKYSRQIEEYVEGLRALGLSVGAAYLLLARSGRHVRVTAA